MSITLKRKRLQNLENYRSFGKNFSIWLIEENIKKCFSTYKRHTFFNGFKTYHIFNNYLFKLNDFIPTKLYFSLLKKFRVYFALCEKCVKNFIEKFTGKKIKFYKNGK